MLYIYCEFLTSFFNLHLSLMAFVSDARLVVGLFSVSRNKQNEYVGVLGRKLLSLIDYEVGMGLLNLI